MYVMFQLGNILVCNRKLLVKLGDRYLSKFNKQFSIKFSFSEKATKITQSSSWF